MRTDDVIASRVTWPDAPAVVTTHRLPAITLSRYPRGAYAVVV